MAQFFRIDQLFVYLVMFKIFERDILCYYFPRESHHFNNDFLAIYSNVLRSIGVSLLFQVPPNVLDADPIGFSKYIFLFDSLKQGEMHMGAGKGIPT